MDKYKNSSKEELIERIKELEYFNEALKEEKNQEELLKFPWAGNLGHWYWNVKTNSVVGNDQKVLALNYDKEDIPKEIGFEFFTSKLHPEDYERVMDNMRDHLLGNTDAFEVEYRIKTKNGSWKWYYDRGKITKRDDNNEPVLLAGIVFDITEKKDIEQLIKRENKKLVELVNFDYLTKILNRRGLLNRLENEIDIAIANKENLSIIMLDIDKFKLVNDKQGHLIGDKVLKQIARNIKKNVLGTDIVGRYGGEEFLVILPNTDEKQAYCVAERIRKNIQSEQFTNGIRLTISGGVKQYHNESIIGFIDQADKYLYKSKENGRNQISYKEVSN